MIRFPVSAARKFKATRKTNNFERFIFTQGGGGCDNVRKGMHNSSPQTCDLLIAHADLLAPLAGDDLPGGWLAVHGGFVKAIGKAGDEPAAHRVVDASGCLVTPGLVNAHHHMYQSLTCTNP
jgi:adenine deaminase